MVTTTSTGGIIPQNSTQPNGGTDFLNNIIPGFNGLNQKSSDVIGNLLNGTPNAATAQNAAATFGTTNGFGAGSGIANRFGYDLYGQQGAQRQQQGLGDLSNLIGSVANPTLQNQGQNLQNQQFGANLNQQANEFNSSQQNQDLLTLLGQLGGGSTDPSMNANTSTIH